jgi:hypothetical protein
LLEATDPSEIGRFSLRRTFTLKPSAGLELEVDDGEATLTAANGHRLNASFTGALNPQTDRAILTYEWKEARAGFRIPKMWLTTFWELCGQFRYVASSSDLQITIPL